MLIGTQVRMARAAVGWGVRELAEKAKINPNTVSRIENGGDALASTLDRIQAALEGAGVKLWSVVDRLLNGEPLEARHREHTLSGQPLPSVTLSNCY